MLFNKRERNYVRQLIKLGCPKETAHELSKFQREVWNRQEAVEDARASLRIAIRKALAEFPEFDAGLKALRAKNQSADELS